MNYKGCHLSAFESVLDYQSANSDVKIAYHLVSGLVGFSHVSAGIAWVEPMTLEFSQLKEKFTVAQGGDRTMIESLKNRTYIASMMEIGIIPTFYLDGQRLSATFKFEGFANALFGEEPKHLESHLYYWTSLEAMAVFLKGLGPSSNSSLISRKPSTQKAA